MNGINDNLNQLLSNNNELEKMLNQIKNRTTTYQKIKVWFYMKIKNLLNYDSIKTRRF